MMGGVDGAPASNEGLKEAAVVDGEEGTLDVSEVLSGLNSTLARVNLRLEKKQRELEKLKSERALTGKLKHEVKQLSDEVAKKEADVMALKANYDATKAQFESLRVESETLRTKAQKTEKLTEELRKMERRFKELQRSVSDNDITHRLAEGVAEIGNVLESQELSEALSDGVTGAVEVALGAEGVLEQGLSRQLAQVTDKKTSRFLAFALSWVMLAVPVWLMTLGMQRISGVFSARQHVLLATSVHAVMSTLCLIAWAVLRRDPLSIMYRSSRHNLVVVLFVLLLQCPVLLVLYVRALVAGSSRRERGLVLLSMGAFVINAVFFRLSIWRPLLSQASKHVTLPRVSPTVYAVTLLLSLVSSYSALKARPPAAREELTQDISRVVNELEAVSTGTKVA